MSDRDQWLCLPTVRGNEGLLTVYINLSHVARVELWTGSNGEAHGTLSGPAGGSALAHFSGPEATRRVLAAITPEESQP